MARAETFAFDIARRRRRAARACIAAVALTLLLSTLAFIFSAAARPAKQDAGLVSILWAIILASGLGAIFFRRAQLSPRRIQHLADTGGRERVLRALERTTVAVAVASGAIALAGFIIVSITGEPFDMLRAALISLAVTLSNYPRLRAWQWVEGIAAKGNHVVAKG